MALEALFGQKRQDVLRIAGKYGARLGRVFGSVARGAVGFRGWGWPRPSNQGDDSGVLWRRPPQPTYRGGER